MVQMSSLDVINEILNYEFMYHKDILAEFKRPDNSENNDPMMSLKIDNRGGADSYTIYSFDKDGVDTFPFFNNRGERGLKKICDYILFAQAGDKLVILVIELKSGSGSSSKQLKASRVFVEYLINTAKRLSDSMSLGSQKKIDYKLDNYAIRTIRITKGQKQGTKMGDFKKADGHIIYDWSTFRIGALLHLPED